MKVLVTGANRQIGHDVIELLDFEGIEFLGTDRESLDITNEEQVKRVISDYNPDADIHCAAYTAVDKVEDEKELCCSINVLGTEYLAEACKETNAKMVYISTDDVFDGEGDKPFEVTDKPNPINYYGHTKYEGEFVVEKSLDKYFIVRIPWFFGSNGSNFIKSMLKIGEERNEISVFVDQIGSPTYTYDLAELIVEMVKTDKYGVYHAANEGYCDWYEFACEMFKQAGIEVKVNPIKTEEYPTRAKRGKNLRLSKVYTNKHFEYELQTWQNTLGRF